MIVRFLKPLQFVCMGGSPQRMERFAGHLLAEMGFRLPAGQGITNIACDTDRFAMYKVGPVLAVSVSSRFQFYLFRVDQNA